MAELPSGTVTFLLTDVEGSTALWELAPEAMRTALARHDVLFETAVRDHEGVHIRPRGEGDSRFAVFASAADAVAAALAVQCALGAEPWPTPTPLRVRIGLHTGEAELRDDDYYGSAVNRCARLRGIGHGGQILLSEATATLARDTLPRGTSLLDLGEYRLRDLSRPERLFQLAAPDLPTQFPALTSMDSRRHNLPVQPTPLLGRQTDIEALHALLSRDDVRLVTLTGPGGTGKTRIGVQVAAELLDHFDDGATFVGLAAISDPSLVASTIAQSLGVRDLGKRSVLESLTEYLRDQRLLLVLDNFEQVLPAAPEIAELLGACPGLKILVTSRAALHVRGEQEYPVAPLAVPGAERRWLAEEVSMYPSVALFAQRATAIRPGFSVTGENAGAVAEICRRLDGLPLAIELAAARIRLLSPEAMLVRLERRLPLLTGGARDLPARQRTLRDTIGWSYALLEEGERRLFRRLAAFAGGCTLEAAEAVCDAGGDLEVDVLDGLASLVAKSLVRQEGRVDTEFRFGMLETIREYGLERLDECGEGAHVRRRHARYYLAAAERAERELRGAEQQEWLNRLEAEHDNLRAALQVVIEEDEAEMGLRLGGALSHFWEVRGYRAEGRARLAEVLQLAGTRAYPRSRANVLHELGVLALDHGDRAAARACHEESLAIRRGLGDKRDVARSLVELAWIAADGRDYSTGRALHQESLAIMQELGDRRGIALALSGLGYIASVRGDHAAARACEEENLAIMRELGDRRTVARSLAHLGRVATDQRDHAGARGLLAESLAIARELGDSRVVIDGLEAAAHLASAAGRTGRAARLQGAAEALRETIAVPLSPSERAGNDVDVAVVRAALGDDAFAAAWAAGRSMTPEQAVAYASAEASVA